VEKSLSQRLHEKVFGGSQMSTALSPQLVAANFGVSIPVNESPPGSIAPIRHVEDEQELGPMIDGIKTPRPKTAPESLFAIATTRPRSIKPRNAARAKQVAKP
jgi:hypothetical protein